jgi:hypothetical protein
VADKGVAVRLNRNRKTWLRVGVAVVLVLGTLEVIYWARRIAEERRQADEDSRAAKIIAQAADSRDYSKAREQVVVRQFDLDTLKRVITEEFHRQTMKRVDGYFEQKTDQQRAAYLDRVIDEALAYQKLTSASRPALAPPTRPTPEGESSFFAWVSQQPAVTRARLAEFSAAFNARLAQRGLPRFEGPLQ